MKVSVRLRSHWLALLIVLLLAAGNLAGARERGLPPSEGIVNFGKVNDRLYRGAQPDAVVIKNLKKLGIKTILNLRLPNDVWLAEEAQATANGLAYTNVPMRGTGRPTPEQVARALAVIETLPSPVFVHCLHGCDRGGESRKAALVAADCAVEVVSRLAAEDKVRGVGISGDAQQENCSR